MLWNKKADRTLSHATIKYRYYTEVFLRMFDWLVYQ